MVIKIGDRSLAVDGPRVWNSLYRRQFVTQQSTLSITVFSNQLKTHLFVQ